MGDIAEVYDLDEWRDLLRVGAVEALDDLLIVPRVRLIGGYFDGIEHVRVQSRRSAPVDPNFAAGKTYDEVVVAVSVEVRRRDLLAWNLKVHGLRDFEAQLGLIENPDVGLGEVAVHRGVVIEAQERDGWTAVALEVADRCRDAVGGG